MQWEKIEKKSKFKLQIVSLKFLHFCFFCFCTVALIGVRTQDPTLYIVNGISGHTLKNGTTQAPQQVFIDLEKENWTLKQGWMKASS